MDTTNEIAMDAPMEKEQAKGWSWQGISTKWFLIMLAVVLAASYLDVIPKGFLGGWTYCLLVGLFFTQIGDKIPFIRKYFGGGTILALFAGSLMVYFHIIPESTVTLVKSFVSSKGMDLFGFLCMALITGSIMGMDRNLLIKAGARFAVPIIGGVIFSAVLTMIGGALMGYGALESLFRVALPIMGAGVASGAVPISEIYSSVSGLETTVFMSQLMPAIAIGNAIAIIIGGFANGMGKRFPSLTGDGASLMKGISTSHKETIVPEMRSIGTGLVMTGIFMSLGLIISKFLPIHYYASTILVAAIVKLLNVLPEEMVEHTQQWYNFMTANAVPMVIFACGVAAMDMGIVISSFTIPYLILVILAVGGSFMGAALLGRLVGFFPIDSGITGGLCMANMGGSGDIATLAASNRMSLMQFAQISSRIGGALIILLINLLAALLGIGTQW